MPRSKEIRYILRAVDKASRQLDDVRSSARGLEGQMGTLGKVVGGVALGELGRRAANATKELYLLGVDAKRTESAFRDAAGGVDEANEMLSALQEASGNTVSEMDLMRSSLRAMELGVADDTETLVGLMQSARVQGRKMGMSTAEAFEDIATGIGRVSPMILDNLGYVFDANQLYGDWAASLGKTRDELTEVEKRGALTNMVLEDAEQVANDQKDSVLELTAAWQDFKKEVGLAILIGEEGIRVGTSILNSITARRKRLNDLKESRDNVNAAIERAVDLGIISRDEAKKWEAQQRINNIQRKTNVVLLDDQEDNQRALNDAVIEGIAISAGVPAVLAREIESFEDLAEIIGKTTEKRYEDINAIQDWAKTKAAAELEPEAATEIEGPAVINPSAVQPRERAEPEYSWEKVADDFHEAEDLISEGIDILKELDPEAHQKIIDADKEDRKNTLIEQLRGLEDLGYEEAGLMADKLENSPTYEQLRKTAEEESVALGEEREHRDWERKQQGAIQESLSYLRKVNPEAAEQISRSITEAQMEINKEILRASDDPVAEAILLALENAPTLEEAAKATTETHPRSGGVSRAASTNIRTGSVHIQAKVVHVHGEQVQGPSWRWAPIEERGRMEGIW